MSKILVTGGNGHLGKHVVEGLLAEGHEIAVLTTRITNSPKNGVQFITRDLFENRGLEEAVAGAEVIIHCASNPRNFEKTDIEGTKNLLNAIDKKTFKHFIYISILGIDKSDYPYYRGKLEVENLIAQSGIPFTIVRTVQFHDFVLNMIKTLEDQSAESDFITVPLGMKFQSVSINEIAELLVSLVMKDSQGFMEDFGGPEVLLFEEMVQSYLEMVQKSKSIKLQESDDVRHKLFKTGVNLCPENNFGKQTWKEYLTDIL